jgi:hypothetical protein
MHVQQCAAIFRALKLRSVAWMAGWPDEFVKHRSTGSQNHFFRGKKAVQHFWATSAIKKFPKINSRLNRRKLAKIWSPCSYPWNARVLFAVAQLVLFSCLWRNQALPHPRQPWKSKNWKERQWPSASLRLPIVWKPFWFMLFRERLYWS